MINTRRVYFYWGGSLLFGPPNAYLWGGPPPPRPPGNRRACLRSLPKLNNVLQNSKFHKLDTVQEAAPSTLSICLVLSH